MKIYIVAGEQGRYERGNPAAGSRAPRVRSAGQEAHAGNGRPGPGITRWLKALHDDPRAFMRRCVLTALGTLPAQVLRDKVPVHEIPPRRDILGAGVTIINIIRMLPDIAGQQWGFAITQRTAGI